MNGFGFRMPLVWLVAAGLVACGAAGETPGMRGTNGTSTAGTTSGANDDPLLLGNPLSNADQSDTGDISDEADNGADDAGDLGDGAEPMPGVDVTVDEQGITVSIDVPGGSVIKLTTKNGTCATAGNSVYIDGDVTMDLGAGVPLPLADADLQIEVGSGMPTLSGTANVTGSLLDGIGCGCAHDLLPVAVSLDADAMADLPGAAGDLAIAMNLAMNDVAIDALTLPSGMEAVMLDAADVTIRSDGTHRWVSVAGQVAADADVWASSVPLQGAGMLAARAMVADGSLIELQLQGSVTLQGGKLWCGLTPLRELTMPEALITLDQEGLWLHATAQASAHPGFSVTGNALVDGRFTSEAWSLMVCADVMTDVISASVKVGQCITMTPGGSEMCDCHRDDDGHCEGAAGGGV